MSRVARVPAWFARVMSLPQAQAQRVVSDGWRQTGAVTIVVDDDYALVSLWRSSTRIATLVVLAGLVWAAFVTGLLRWFRRVLRDQVAPMVMDIGSDAQQGRSKEQVAVSELRSVMHAIEHTRVQVQQRKKSSRSASNRWSWRPIGIRSRSCPTASISSTSSSGRCPTAMGSRRAMC